MRVLAEIVLINGVPRMALPAPTLHIGCVLTGSSVSALSLLPWRLDQWAAACSSSRAMMHSSPVGRTSLAVGLDMVAAMGRSLAER